MFTASAHAAVSSIEPKDRVQRNADGAIDVCFYTPVSPETMKLIEAIELHLKEQLTDRVGLKLAFNRDCFSLPNALKAIGIAFYDDPLTIPGIKTEVEFVTAFPESLGHPQTFAHGVWVHQSLVDINLTSRFGQVAAQLDEQAKDLSPAGKLNLIRSIALHEFLHALGMVHEQNHKDSTCTEGAESYSPHLHTLLTPYDPDSIMNYCQTHHHDFEQSALELTPLDIEGLRKLYF